jgi:hypothetical protein
MLAGTGRLSRPLRAAWPGPDATGQGPDTALCAAATAGAGLTAANGTQRGQPAGLGLDQFGVQGQAGAFPFDPVQLVRWRGGQNGVYHCGGFLAGTRRRRIQRDGHFVSLPNTADKTTFAFSAEQIN